MSSHFNQGWLAGIFFLLPLNNDFLSGDLQSKDLAYSLPWENVLQNRKGVCVCVCERERAGERKRECVCAYTFKKCSIVCSGRLCMHTYERSGENLAYSSLWQNMYTYVWKIWRTVCVWDYLYLVDIWKIWRSWPWKNVYTYVWKIWCAVFVRECVYLGYIWKIWPTVYCGRMCMHTYERSGVQFACDSVYIWDTHERSGM